MTISIGLPYNDIQDLSSLMFYQESDDTSPYYMR